jgi:hypothetical protein
MIMVQLWCSGRSAYHADGGTREGRQNLMACRLALDVLLYLSALTVLSNDDLLRLAWIKKQGMSGMYGVHYLGILYPVPIYC